MAMYDSKPIPTRRPIERPQPPVLSVGDRVRVRHMLTTDPGVLEHDGAYGTVVRLSGNRVVVQLDTAYVAAGVRQRTFYSFAEELEPVEVVGRMGAVDLYADDQEEEEA
jgi:hypothetical protein